MTFTVSNPEIFQSNSTICSINTRNKNHWNKPTANLSWFQKGACYSCIKISNNLPCSLKLVENKKMQIRVELKR